MRIEPTAGVPLSTSPAVGAFLFDFAQVASAYEYNWSLQESFARRAAYLAGGGYRGDRPALSAALMRYQEALGADPVALQSVSLLAKEETLAVVTGQQAGIFTGPAYSIYKAMTVIHLARQQQARLGVPVVPVFWIAGEDHDWQEAAHVMIPAGDGMTRLGLADLIEGDRRSVGLAPTPDSLQVVLTEFIALLPDTEFKAEITLRVRAAAESAPALRPELTGGQATLADWFARLMIWLFAGTGLVLLNSADPALRRLQGEFFAQAIARHQEVQAAFLQGCNRFEAMGFSPSVERQEGSLHLFTYIDGQRLPLFGDGNRYWVRGHEEINWSQAELLQLADQAPERFSTNVVLRPVIQGWLFPDLAYVGGPGEINYFGLLRDVFGVFEGQMPIVYPRESYTLIEPPLARILDKHGLTFEDLFGRIDEVRREYVEREDRLGIADLFERFRTDFGGLYNGVVEQVLLLDQSLQPVIEDNRKQIAVQINKLEEKARQQHRKNLEVALRQFDRLRAHLNPSGLQERSVSILPYLVKYGPNLVQQLVEQTALTERWCHQVVYL